MQARLLLEVKGKCLIVSYGPEAYMQRQLKVYYIVIAGILISSI